MLTLDFHQMFQPTSGKVESIVPFFEISRKCRGKGPPLDVKRTSLLMATGPLVAAAAEASSADQLLQHIRRTVDDVFRDGVKNVKPKSEWDFYEHTQWVMTFLIRLHRLPVDVLQQLLVIHLVEKRVAVNASHCFSTCTVVFSYDSLRKTCQVRSRIANLAYPDWPTSNRHSTAGFN